MRNRPHSPIWSCLTLASLLFIASHVDAQDNPELGDVRHTPPPEPATASGSARVSARGDGPFDRTVATSGNDHASVVGHFGVGVFGVMSLPVASSLMDTNGSLSAPMIGARYWLSERMGIEGGLGLGFLTGGSTTETNNVSVEVNDPTLFGLGLHAGLPLVFASGAHYAFQLVPELNFGFVTGGQDLPANDIDLSGLLLELGARVGAEIQFGFIGIPQLALQATVGVHLRYEGRGASNDMTDISIHRFGFGTTVQGKPWDIFVSNISAIYYF